MTRRLLILLPLAVLLAFIVAVAWRLASPGDTVIRSKQVGQPVGAFTIPPALPDSPPYQFAADSTPRLVNFFASWCAPCIGEAPFLLEMKKRGIVIDGIAVRDRPEDTATFLSHHGDPYARTGADRDSQVQLRFGASGVPETFVIDRAGRIVFQHVGPIDAAAAADLERRVKAIGG